jgi:hypothetical protein
MAEVVKGLTGLLKKLEQLPAEYDVIIDAEVEEAARQISVSAIKIVPYRTRALQRSIGVVKVEDKTWKVATNVQVYEQD